MRYLFFFFLLFSTLFLSAQRSRDYALSIGSQYSGEAIAAYDMREKVSQGATYFNEDWYQGAAKLIDGKKVENYLLKFDLLAHELDVKDGAEVKVIPGDWIEEFVLYPLEAQPGEGKSHRFIRIDLFFDIKSNDEAFYELKYHGEKLSFLVRHRTETLQPNYVPALDVGSVSPKVVKREDFLLFDGKDLIEIPTKKRKALSFFENYRPDAEKYFQRHKPNFKDPEEVQAFIKYCDQP